MATVTTRTPGLLRLRSEDLPYADLAGPGYGLDNTGTVSVSSAVNNIIAEMIAGDTPAKPLLFNGKFKTDEPIVIDRSAITADPSTHDRTVISLLGHGTGLSQIRPNHNGVCIDYRGNGAGGVHSFFYMKGLGLYGPSRAAGSIGFKADNLAFFKFTDVDFCNFEFGLNATDIVSGAFDSCYWRDNKYGLLAIQTDLVSPNAISFRSPVFSGNFKYGGYVTGGTGVSFLGGSIEGNGVDASPGDTDAWGFRIVDAGVQGGSGLSMMGTYIENNCGYADIQINSSAQVAMHSFVGCTFNRSMESHYSLYQIIHLAGGSGVASRIHLAACGFKRFSPYVNDVARPHITGAPFTFSDGGGNHFDYSRPSDVWDSQRLHYSAVAALPSAAGRTGEIIAVTNGDAGALCLAISDGTNWKRVVLGATVAAT